MRLLFFVVLTLSLGVLTALWSLAQSAKQNVAKEPIKRGNNAGIDQLTAFVSYLEQNKQTNALRLFNEYSTASIALQNSVEIGVTLRLLLALREGRTNDAIESLEGKLDTAIVSLAASFRELPEAQQAMFSLHSLTNASWYRTKFPHKHPHKSIDASVAEAFELLNKTSGK